MTLSKYKLTSKKIVGQIILVYEDHYLKSVLFDLKQPLNGVQELYVREHLQYSEFDLQKDGMGLLAVTPLSADKTTDKIALFCRFFMQYKKDLEGQPIKYKCSPSDAGKIKHVDMTEKLLKVYFESDNFLFKGKQTIGNYAKYYNELRVEAQSDPNALKFPAKYDRDYEKKLTGPQLTEYWVHLRKIGLNPIKRNNTIIDWQ